MSTSAAPIAARGSGPSAYPAAARSGRYGRHALHHVEVDAQDAVGAAEVQRRAAPERRGLEGLLHAVLAHHVVRGGEDVAERGPPQDDLAGIHATR